MIDSYKVLIAVSAVLKLAFTDRLVWDRKGLYRTPQLSLPFKLLGDFLCTKQKWCGSKEMV